jgi:hypothetical protein
MSCAKRSHQPIDLPRLSLEEGCTAAVCRRDTGRCADPYVQRQRRLVAEDW